MPIQHAFSSRLTPILPEIVEKYGTPFHIYDERGIVAAHSALVRAFSAVEFRQYFAVKALPNPHVLRILLNCGSGFDCSSPAEIRLAQLAGATGSEIMFTSNNTTAEEHDHAASIGAGVILDDCSLLKKFSRLAPVAAFRAAPLPVEGDSSFIGEAAQSKFGVPPDQIVPAYQEAKARGVKRFGIHGMTCSNELSAVSAGAAASSLIAHAASVAAALGETFEFINIGGGLGIPYKPSQAAFDVGEFGRIVSAALRKFFNGARPPKIITECGRYITGPHGVLVSRVVNRYRKVKDFVGLDASMSALMRPGFYRHSAYHHITIPYANGRQSTAVDVVGSLCENIDKFAIDRELPDPGEGDIVIIHDTGAHGHAMGFTYNGRLRPAELLLTDDGQVLEIRRAETFEDYIGTVADGRAVLTSVSEARAVAPA